jgi:hypothetical protein
MDNEATVCSNTVQYPFLDLYGRHEAVHQCWMGPHCPQKPAFGLDSVPYCQHLASLCSNERCVLSLMDNETAVTHGNILCWTLIEYMKQCSSIGWVLSCALAEARFWLRFCALLISPLKWLQYLQSKHQKNSRKSIMENDALIQYHWLFHAVWMLKWPSFPVKILKMITILDAADTSTDPIDPYCPFV